MSCNQTDIHRYHDGELAPGDRRRTETHLAECTECRALLESLRHLSARLRMADAATLPPGMMERLRRSAPAMRDRGIVRLAGWLTATAAAVLLGALLLNSGQRLGVAGRPATWEAVAVTPPDGLLDEGNSELVVTAEWMADDLHIERR